MPNSGILCARTLTWHARRLRRWTNDLPALIKCRLYIYIQVFHVLYPEYIWEIVVERLENNFSRYGWWHMWLKTFSNDINRSLANILTNEEQVMAARWIHYIHCLSLTYIYSKLSVQPVNSWILKPWILKMDRTYSRFWTRTPQFLIFLTID